MDRIENITVSGPEAEVSVRVYAMNTGKPAPAILYYGGGLALGSIELFDIACRKLCRVTGAVVISTGYRLGSAASVPGGSRPYEENRQVYWWEIVKAKGEESWN